MNYTENYHLPQWEETDRVLRTDFNELCAVLEEALTASGRAQRRLAELARDAYRREVQHRVRLGGGVETDAMWVNTLTSREEAGGDGHAWNGKYGVCLGEGSMPTLEGIKASAVTEDYIYTAHDSSRRYAAVRFTSDGCGTLETVNIWTYNLKAIGYHDFYYTITMTRLDTNEVVGTAGPFQTECLEDLCKQVNVPINLPLEAGVSYRMSFSVPEGFVFGGNTGFALNCPEPMVANANPLTLAARGVAGSIAKTVPARNASGAFGIVRWKGDGTFSLSIDGQVMTPVWTRDDLNAEGETCKISQFSLTGPLDGDIPVVLNMEHGTDDLHIFDYGLIWQ